jgi:hypothetical protein
LIHAPQQNLPSLGRSEILEGHPDPRQIIALPRSLFEIRPVLVFGHLAFNWHRRLPSRITFVLMMAHDNEIATEPRNRLPQLWLDLAESELGVLSSQCLDRRIPDKQPLIEEIAAWVDDRNARHTKAN